MSSRIDPTGAICSVRLSDCTLLPATVAAPKPVRVVAPAATDIDRWKEEICDVAERRRVERPAASVGAAGVLDAAGDEAAVPVAWPQPAIARTAAPAATSEATSRNLITPE